LTTAAIIGTAGCLLFGLIIGSFLNVCIYRIPEGSFLKHHRSVCACGEVIRWYHNIPVISFFWLRARAACCGRKISVQYPLVELLTGIIFAMLFSWFPFFSMRNGLPALHELEAIRYAHAAILSSVLIVCSVIDMRHLLIPDRLSIPMIVLSPLVAGIHPDLKLLDSFMGVVFGAGLLYAIAWVYWLVRRRVGLGFGDVKLLAFIGGWMGATSILPTVFVASVAGSVVGITALIINRQISTQSALPFGPFLAIGAFGYMLYGDKLHHILGF
jgi:leader peptidase (prepilin peptidase)/N-methyltransferase